MKLVKLSEICTFSRGLTYSKSDEVEFSNNVVLRANNIDLDSNSLNLEDLRYIKDSIQIKKEKIAKKNSLIICTASGSKSHVGKVALIDEDYGYAFGGFMGQLTPTDKCHPKFLYYVVTSGSFKDFLMSLNDGTNINNLKFSDIENYEILLPSLEKQREIVEKLDSAFAEIDLLEENLALSYAKVNELLQSVLISKFKSTDESKELNNSSVNQEFKAKFVRIGDVCKLMTGGTPSRARPEFFENGTIKWLVSGDINKVEIFDCDGRITVEAMKSSNTRILPMNSVMIALNGQGKTRGTVALLRTEATCNQSLVSISPINEQVLLSEFLFHNLRMRYQELRRMTGDDGNDRRGLNMVLIRDIQFPLPSLDKQREIVEVLDSVFTEIDSFRAMIKREVTNAATLRQSLLNSAFTQDEAVA